MILSNKLVDTQDNLAGTNFGLDQANMGLLFDMLRNRLYTDPLEAMIRELASNCVDSYPKNSVEKKVYITVNFEEDKLFNKYKYIEFSDHGVGMSPETITNVYCKYLSSTKRDDNDNIGGFGLGAKTPFAITDEFIVITHNGGIRYEYIAFIDETGLGKISLLKSNESDGVGTTVRIPYNVRPSILHTITKILVLFDYEITVLGLNQSITDGKMCNILVEIDKVTITPLVNYVRNDLYSIAEIDGSTIKGICIGDNLIYNISDFKSKLSTIESNIGYSFITTGLLLNFDVGELDLPPNRESITINNKNIKIIDDKLYKVGVHIKNILDKEYELLPDFVKHIAPALYDRVSTRLEIILQWLPNAIKNLLNGSINNQTAAYLLWTLFKRNENIINNTSYYGIICANTTVHSYDEKREGNRDKYGNHILFVQFEKDNPVSSYDASEFLVESGYYGIIEIKKDFGFPKFYEIEKPYTQYAWEGYKMKPPREIIKTSKPVKKRADKTSPKINTFPCDFIKTHYALRVLPWEPASTDFSPSGTLQLTYDKIKQCIISSKLYTNKSNSIAAENLRIFTSGLNCEGVIWILDENICKRLERDLKISKFTDPGETNNWYKFLGEFNYKVNLLNRLHGGNNLLIYGKLLQECYDLPMDSVKIAKIIGQLAVNSTQFNSVIPEDLRKYHGIDINTSEDLSKIYVNYDNNYNKSSYGFNDCNLLNRITGNIQERIYDLDIIKALLITLNKIK